mgnify:CR=1 FL=1
MRRRRETIEEEYLYKALQLRESLQVSEEKNVGTVEKSLEMSKADRLSERKKARTGFTEFLIRQIPFIGWKMWSIQALVMITALIFFCGTDRGVSGYDMAAHGKAACVLGRSTGNCYGDDRDPLCDAVFPVSDV